jgi:uncharacterized membrane protein
MNKKILFGSILSVFLIMMLPSISAVEFKTAEEEQKTQLIENLQKIDTKNLLKMIQEQDPSYVAPQCIGVLSVIIGLLVGIFSKTTVGIAVATLGILAGISFSAFKIIVILTVITAMVIIGARIMNNEENQP